MRQEYKKVGKSTKVRSEGAGQLCPVCKNCFKQLLKHMIGFHKWSRADARSLILKDKNSMAQKDRLFFTSFEKQYLNNRLSGTCSISSYPHVKYLEGIVKFLRTRLCAPHASIEELFSSTQTMQKLGEKDHGYIDLKVVELFTAWM